MEPIDVLQWLVAGGAFVATSWFASWGLEELQWWHTLHSKARSLIVLVISAVIGVGASLLLERPETVEALRPVLVPILLTIAAWLATQTAHKFAKGGSGEVTLVDAQVETVEVEAPVYRGGTGGGAG